MKFWKRIPWKKLGWGLAVFYAIKAVVYLSLMAWAYYYFAEPLVLPEPMITIQR